MQERPVFVSERDEGGGERKRERDEDLSILFTQSTVLVLQTVIQYWLSFQTIEKKLNKTARECVCERVRERG